MYDPLADQQLHSHQPRADSYWQAHTAVEWPCCGELPAHTDVLVIGAGYTGLNAAQTIAGKYQRDVTVIDANALAWGCSSRNAGFVMKSTGRLGLSQWANKFGTAMAENIAAEHELAHQRIRQHIDATPSRCDRQSGGYIKLAHRAQAVPALKQQYQTLTAFKQPVSWLTAEELPQLVNSQHAFAGLKFDDCFTVNPLKLAAASAKAAADAGATLVEHCSAESITRLAAGWRVKTSMGVVECNKLLVCTNAYTANTLFGPLTGRSLPVLSSIITTPPLTEEQLQQTHLTPQHAFMDTRTLKYYFRLLPDNRLLMGGRGAIRGRNANDPFYAQHLLNALKSSFPALADIKQWQHFWSGWVSVSLDDYPRVGTVADNAYAAMGYCGAGVSFSALAGQRLAEAAMGDKLPDLPYYKTPLKRFPFAPLRRIGQWAFYHYARMTE